MATEWTWGSNQKAVAITENDIKAVVGRIVEAVIQNNTSEMLEQYRQFVRTEADLARAREDLTRKDAEIANLQARIAQLNGLLSTMAQVGGPHQIAVTQALPAFPERYAASAPLPPLQFTPDGIVPAPAGS